MKHVFRLALVWLIAVNLPLPLILVLDLQLVDTPMHLFAGRHANAFVCL